jgi:hypothetical protein
MDTSLKPYPMPPGAPRLMPYQDHPWNGDGYAAAEVKRLAIKHGLRWAIETGTCYGSTTMWLAEHFSEVYSFEVHGPSFDIARQRCGDFNLYHTDSVQGLRMTLPNMQGMGLCFLDAHWGSVCPLLSELEAIAQAGIRPVIMIHDWQVPGRPDLGFDLFPDGTPFHLDAIKSHLDAIYGVGGWEHHYNDKAEGAKRGIIYVEPA